MAAATKNYPPNDKKRRESTRKRNECQLCHTKIGIKSQYTVTNDLDAGKAIKGRKGTIPEGSSHYCGDCADKRVKQKQTWLDARENGSTPKPKAKATKAAKATKKAPAKKAAKKPAAKAKASAAADPF